MYQFINEIVDIFFFIDFFLLKIIDENILLLFSINNYWLNIFHQYFRYYFLILW
jgi:hypothetical protein